MPSLSLNNKTFWVGILEVSSVHPKKCTKGKRIIGYIFFIVSYKLLKLYFIWRVRMACINFLIQLFFETRICLSHPDHKLRFTINFFFYPFFIIHNHNLISTGFEPLENRPQAMFMVAVKCWSIAQLTARLQVHIKITVDVYFFWFCTHLLVCKLRPFLHNKTYRWILFKHVLQHWKMPLSYFNSSTGSSTRGPGNE